MSSGATDQPLPLFASSASSDDSDSSPGSPLGLSDEELLLRIESGDTISAAVLFDRYADLILGIGVRILRDRGEAEDLVQEVFLQLVEKVRGFDPAKGSGRTWIVQVAYRRAFDRRAYLARRQFYDGTDVEHVRNTLQGKLNFESRILDSLSGEQLHRAFDDLSERQRVALEMFFFEGLELREISERLGEPLENIRHFYYRGLERLRRSVIGMTRQEK